MELNKKDETELYNRYNVDDVFNRVVIVGLLDLMNNKITYEQIYENNVIEYVHVPIMYDFGSSDERFAQDNYTFFGSACFGDKKIDGKFDMLPRGAIKYTGSQIDAANITNKSVRGNFTRNENGKIVTYSALLFTCPLTFNFECEMWIDNLDTAFKIEQSIREIFYKNRTYNVLYRGQKVPCRVGFPESSTLTKTVSYSFDSERQMKLNFNLAVETYQPIFTEPIPTDTKIQYFGIDLTYDFSQKKDIILKLDRDLFPRNTVILSDTPTLIKWDSYSNVSELMSVKLSYIEKETGKEHTIAAPFLNKGFYIWNVPSLITGYKSPSITFLLTEGEVMDEQPIIRIVPNIDKTITPDSFVILSQGLFHTDRQYIPIALEYTVPETGKTVMNISNYEIKIKDRQIDFENPVRITPGKNVVKYEGNCERKPILLKLSYPLDTTFFDQIDNLFIL